LGSSQFGFGPWVQFAFLSFNWTYSFCASTLSLLLAVVFRTFGLYTAKSALVILSLDSLLSALTCIPVYLTLKYAAGERAGATRRMAVGNLPLRNLFLGSSSLGLCLSLFSICNLLLFRAAASLARKLLGMVRLWHSLRSHGSVQSLSSLNVSLSSSDRSLES
jgi:hypothetical protein